MGSLNRVTLIGHLGAAPEFKDLNGKSVINFRMATNESWSDKDGERQERVEWHAVQAWGKLAQLCNSYLVKGGQCCFEGKLRSREWTDKENKQRQTFEVVAENVVFLGGKPATSADHLEEVA